MKQAIPQTLVQWITRRYAAVYYPMRGAAWVKTSDASAVRVGIYDGTTTTYSDYIDSDGVPHFPTVSVQTNANQTEFELWLEVAAGENTADFSFGGLMQNTLAFESAFNIRDMGSQAYREYRWDDAPRNVGGFATVEIPNWTGYNCQLIIYTRRPFPEMADFDDVVEDQYARAIEAGMLVWTLQAIKPSQDRTRLDRILVEEQAIWTRFLQNQVDLPVHTPMNTMTIGSS
jgi:hypothetical protein